MNDDSDARKMNIAQFQAVDLRDIAVLQVIGRRRNETPYKQDTYTVVGCEWQQRVATASGNRPTHVSQNNNNNKASRQRDGLPNLLLSPSSSHRRRLQP
jgi:hypothetical protein